MPQYAMAISGSSVAAWRKERSDSMNQNECICETPWLKNFLASSDRVVTGMFVSPMPGRSFAGNGGCAPGGTAHRSASGRCCAAISCVTDPGAVTRSVVNAAMPAYFIAKVEGHYRDERRRS